MMKTVLWRLLPVALLLTSSVMATEDTDTPLPEKKIYRSQDARGNTVFSDRGASTDAEVEVEAPMTFPAGEFARDYERFTAGNDDAPPEPAFKPYALLISAPAADTTIRANDGTVTIAWQVNPVPEPQYRVDLLMDGEVLREVRESASLTLSNVDRGTHQLQLRVKHRETGETLQQSTTHTFTLLRHSKLH